MTVDYRKEATRIAKQHGLPVPVFLSLVQHESAWQPHVTSPVGAIGLTQLMPGTAKSLGVDPLDPLQNLEGGARYLKTQLDKFGKIDLALAAYNAGPGAVEKYNGIPPFDETRSYVKNIMASYAPSTTSTPSVKKYASVTGPASTFTRSPLPPLPSMDLLSPIGPTPGMSVADTALNNLGLIAKGGKATSLLGSLVSATQQQSPQDVPGSVSSMSPPPGVPTTGPPIPDLPVRGGKGDVFTAPGADRHGVHTSQKVKDFVAEVAGLHGAPLTITTGTNHNEYVAGENHVQSQHWTGDAADVAFGHGTGPDNIDPALTKLGQEALIAAGADPAWARQQTGGAYTIGGHNILFNTMVGGNHFNHLHVGA